MIGHKYGTDRKLVDHNENYIEKYIISKKIMDDDHYSQENDLAYYYVDLGIELEYCSRLLKSIPSIIPTLPNNKMNDITKNELVYVRRPYCETYVRLYGIDNNNDKATILHRINHFESCPKCRDMNMGFSNYDERKYNILADFRRAKQIYDKTVNYDLKNKSKINKNK